MAHSPLLPDRFTYASLGLPLDATASIHTPGDPQPAATQPHRPLICRRFAWPHHPA
jgi:hypothetical protein